jgi:hypothetical protein
LESRKDRRKKKGPGGKGAYFGFLNGFEQREMKTLVEDSISLHNMAVVYSGTGAEQGREDEAGQSEARSHCGRNKVKQMAFGRKVDEMSAGALASCQK